MYQLLWTLSLVPNPDHKRQEGLQWRNRICHPFPKQPLPLCPFPAPGGRLLSPHRLRNDFPGRVPRCPRRAALSLPEAGSLSRGGCAAPGRAPRRAAPGDALPAPLPGAFLSSPNFFFFFNIFLFRPLLLSLLSEEERGGGEGREKYCLNSQKGGIWCTLRLASVLLVSPEQRARTGAGGRRGSRASVGRHNKVTKQRRRADPAAFALLKCVCGRRGRGGGGPAPRYYAPGR